MESTALSKAQLSSLVEGWTPRFMTAGQDLASNAGAALGGMLAAKYSPGVAMAVGSILQLGNAAAGPRHPWIQLTLGRPGVGMNDAGIGIKVFLRAKGATPAGE